VLELGDLFEEEEELEKCRAIWFVREDILCVELDGASVGVVCANENACSCRFWDGAGEVLLR